jgi:hypothetical protein
MAYTATELITRAYYLSSIVGQGLETVSGDQLTAGLKLLNYLLSFKSADQRLIPYYDRHNFTSVVDQEKYEIEGLILCETLTFVLNQVRFSMRGPLSREQYFGSGRANNIITLPNIFHLERIQNGSNLYIFPKPNIAYEFEMYGKFNLPSVELNEDLLLKFDAYYLEYLRFALAEYICLENNIQFQPDNDKKLKELEKKVFDISPIDFTSRKMTVFTKSTGTDRYLDANIARGFRPF